MPGQGNYVDSCAERCFLLSVDRCGLLLVTQRKHKEGMRISKRNHVPSGVAPSALRAADVPRDQVPYEGISRYTGSHKENMEMLLKFSYDLPVSLVKAKNSRAGCLPSGNRCPKLQTSLVGCLSPIELRCTQANLNSVKACRSI